MLRFPAGFPPKAVTAQSDGYSNNSPFPFYFDELSAWPENGADNEELGKIRKRQANDNDNTRKEITKQSPSYHGPAAMS